MQVTFVP